MLMPSETDYKLVESWNDNGTVTFRQKKKWIFQESLSEGSLRDVVTNINPVAAVSHQFYCRKFGNFSIETFGLFFRQLLIY